MFHLVKTRSKVKPFSVVLLSENGEVLNEHRLKTKQACFKNLVAVMDNIKVVKGNFTAWVDVQDDTVTSMLGYKVYNNGDVVLVEGYDPKPKYIPGKNPSKKKKSSK
jgi:hypothetical protein